MESGNLKSKDSRGGWRQRDDVIEMTPSDQTMVSLVCHRLNGQAGRSCWLGAVTNHNQLFPPLLSNTDFQFVAKLKIKLWKSEIRRSQKSLLTNITEKVFKVVILICFVSKDRNQNADKCKRPHVAQLTGQVSNPCFENFDSYFWYLNSLQASKTTY